VIPIYSIAKEILQGGGGGILYNKGALFFSNLSYSTQFPPFTFFGSYCETTYNRLYVHDLRLDSTLQYLRYVNKPILTRPIDEGFVFVRHANGRWWWLVGQLAQVDSFYTFLIKNDTIIGPYYHHSFTSSKVCSCFGDGLGQLKVSNDGKFLARITYTSRITIYEFDRCTGTITSGRDITNVPFTSSQTQYEKFGVYGCSFSASGKVLIVNTPTEVLQYNLSTFPIGITRRIVFTDTSTNLFPQALSLSQLGPDNKVYLAKGSNTPYPEDTTNLNPFFNYLGVVQNPDELVAPVQVNLNGLYLGSKSRVRGGLPNIPNFSLGPLPTPCNFTPVEPTRLPTYRSFIVYPNPASTTIILKANEGNLNGQLNFYNLSGQVVYQVNLSIESTHEWNVSGLPSGIYYLRLTDETSEPFVQKVVVNR
jgi:hypothetical protein